MRRTTRLVLLACCYLPITGVLHAAQWAQALRDLYNHPSIGADALHPTSDGGYLLAGEKWGNVGTDAWVVKLNAEGAVVWQRAYDSAGSESATSARRTVDGGYVVAGIAEALGTSPSETDAWLLKLDASGNALWHRQFGGSGYERFYSLGVTPDGGLVVAGDTSSWGAGGSDAWVVRLDAGGNVAWQKTYGGTDFDSAASVDTTSDGGYLVAGVTRSFAEGQYAAWVLRLDGAGNPIWQKSFGGTGSYRASAVRSTLDGGAIVVGTAEIASSFRSDLWVLRLDGAGRILWQRTVGGPHDDSASAVVPTADGGHLVTGMKDSGCILAGAHWCQAWGATAWFLKLDDRGQIIWQKTYGIANYDYATSAWPTLDGGFVVAGNAWAEYLEGGSGAWVLKLNANGGIAGCADLGTVETSPVDDATAARATAAVIGTAGPSPVPAAIESRDGGPSPQQRCYDPSPAARMSAVEYFHAGYGHYFLTALPQEIRALDDGTLSGWLRTGESFDVLAPGTPNVARVCRFWSGGTFAPKSSHFYTPFDWECAEVKTSPDWLFEGEVFGVQLPTITGACRIGTIPLNRLYNDGAGDAPNHRYTIKEAIRSDMMAQGWIPEGFGPKGVIGCVPNP